MNFKKSLQAKDFYRFTGPPEHWLTAIQYMTWGLEDKYEKRWRNIKPGDVFFIHSTGPSSSAFRNARSGIIGIGVIGSEFSRKEGNLWWFEKKNNENKWPLLIPFSEIYLFSELPDRQTWESLEPGKTQQIEKLINILVQKRVPVSIIDGFPQMGSFSSVSDGVAWQILQDDRPLVVYSREDPGVKSLDVELSERTTFQKIEDANQSLRYAQTLQIFDEVKPRIIRETETSYTKDNELLARAEKVHSNILQKLIDIFQSKGYETLYNEHVDLFAHNGQQSYLIDVKSLENKNFKSQARKGIAQILEYDYFEVSKFIEENNLALENKYRSLVFSKEPQRENYIEFMNYLNIGVALPGGENLTPVGQDLGFSEI